MYAGSYRFEALYWVHLVVEIRSYCRICYWTYISRINVSSLAFDVDSSWLPVKRYIEKDMKVQHTDEDPVFLDHYDPESLHEILDT